MHTTDLEGKIKVLVDDASKEYEIHVIFEDDSIDDENEDVIEVEK
ncbi:hypothetical protein [Psychrobacter immobilis]|nr:hypothetical protein [Psychrobacter immobilis]